jgi:hypothetical protein
MSEEQRALFTSLMKSAGSKDGRKAAGAILAAIYLLAFAADARKAKP